MDDHLKLRDDFQREHLYEGLIDFLQCQNQNVEGKTLAYSDMLIVLEILETGSMNEAVRGNLSEKKKIKDLFLVVVKSVEISKNKKMISSLVQFFSNLCYGTGKLRQMLAKDDQSELMGVLKQILDQIRVDEKYEDPEDADENDDPNAANAKIAKFLKKEMADKSLLKQALYSLIGNLCMEKALRVKFAGDT